MSPFLQLTFILAVIVLAAKTAGYLSTLLDQPSVLGELLVGIILGPSLIDLLHLPIITDTHLDEVIHELGELGVLLLMFMAGLELHFSELARNTRVSAYAGILGVVLPVGLGWGISLLFGLDTTSALFLGLVLGATSVSISAQTLIELNVLRSRVGLGLLGAAVFDDVLVILFLSAFLALAGGGGSLLGLGIIFLRMVLFLAISVGFGLWVLPRWVRWVSHLGISQGTLSLALVVMLLYGLAAEVVGGMAAITGTFVAGLMFGRMPEKNRLETGIHSLSYGLLVPIFFVSIGLSINLRELEVNALWLMLAISLVAVIGKVLGSGLGARLGGFSWLESLQLGVGMSSRGEVGLIVASVGVLQGLINNLEFSAVVGMVLITTLLTPPMLRALFSKKNTIEARESNVPEEIS